MSKPGYGFFEYEGETETRDILLKWCPFLKFCGTQDVVETATNKKVGMIYLVRCADFIKEEIEKEIHKKHPERYEWQETLIKVDDDGNASQIG